MNRSPRRSRIRRSIARRYNSFTKDLSVNGIYSAFSGILLEPVQLVLFALAIFTTASWVYVDNDIISSFFVWIANSNPSLCDFIQVWGPRFYEVPWYLLITWSAPKTTRLFVGLIALAVFLTTYVHWILLATTFATVRVIFRSRDPMTNVVFIAILGVLCFADLTFETPNLHDVYSKCHDTDWSSHVDGMFSVGSGLGSRPETTTDTISSKSGKRATVWNAASKSSYLTCSGAGHCPERSECVENYCLITYQASGLTACPTGNAYDTTHKFCYGTTAAASVVYNDPTVIEFYFSSAWASRSGFVHAQNLMWEDFPWNTDPLRVVYDNGTIAYQYRNGSISMLRNETPCEFSDALSAKLGAHASDYCNFLKSLTAAESLDSYNSVVESFSKVLPFTHRQRFVDALVPCAKSDDIMTCALEASNQMAS